MKFKFFIGGFLDSHFELVFEKGHLLCFTSIYSLRLLQPSHTFSVHDDPDWELLLKFLKTLKWKEIYEIGICDGTQWTLEVNYEKIKIKSYGSNVYPPGFKKLLRLINNITKKHGVSVNY